MNMYAAPSANLPHNGRTTGSGCGCALSAVRRSPTTRSVWERWL